MPPDELRRLDIVSQYLPFAVDDYAAANAAFSKWRTTGEDAEKQVVEVWTYCYVQRYVVMQFLRERGTPSEYDKCMTQAMERARRGMDRVEDPGRFASYISVVCKNTLRNHRRDRRSVVEVHEHMVAEPPEAKPTDEDAALVLYVFAQVIREMPDSIRTIGELRFLEKLEYTEIAERTGKPLPTVRTYAARVMTRLRQDDRVRALYYEDLPPADAGTDDGDT